MAASAAAARSVRAGMNGRVSGFLMMEDATGRRLFEQRPPYGNRAKKCVPQSVSVPNRSLPGAVILSGYRPDGLAPASSNASIVSALAQNT